MITQIKFYVESKTEKLIRKNAKSEKLSISEYMRKFVEESMQ